MAAIDLYQASAINKSTTVEILWPPLTPIVQSVLEIYNSRNFMAAIDDYGTFLDGESTTVEIL